jgi:hypothetical protein
MSSIITLPIRLPLEITYRAAKLGLGVVRTVAGILEHDEADQRVPWPAEEDVRDSGDSPLSRAEPVAVEHVEAPVAFDSPGPEELAPTHLDTEDTLAYEAGPADDPGAEIHVGAPWAGYDRMHAADIVDRLRIADEATRAVVRLYEQQGKARSSVLAATA